MCIHITYSNIRYRAVCLLADKEEIGSMGNTGMESNVFSTFLSEILNKLNINRPNLLDKVLCNSKMLSADVDAGLDPIYVSVADLNNACYLNRGVGMNKYTGVAGKANASDANAEFLAYVRNIFESNNVDYQMAELGKVDKGGGGTIAYILANKGVDVVETRKSRQRWRRNNSLHLSKQRSRRSRLWCRSSFNACTL